MFVRILSMALIGLLLTNCANMNESDCVTANWQLIGFEDGSLGKNESNIANHRKECAKYSITPDLSAYREGHYLGSEKFCTKNHGFSRGSAGQQYQRNCPDQLESAFLTGFSDGQRVYGLKKTLNHYASEREVAYADSKLLEQSIAQKNEQMIADGLNREQRVIIREEIFQQQHQLQDLKDSLPLLKQEFEKT